MIQLLKLIAVCRSPCELHLPAEIFYDIYLILFARFLNYFDDLIFIESLKLHLAYPSSLYQHFSSLLTPPTHLSSSTWLTSTNNIMFLIFFLTTLLSPPTLPWTLAKYIQQIYQMTIVIYIVAWFSYLLFELLWLIIYLIFFNPA